MKILFLFAILLVSCASNKKDINDEDPEEPKGPEKRIVGRIASVSKAGNFVLIQRLGNGTLPSNIIYQSKGPEGRSASLRPSGERVRDFYAADLLSGTVETGDAVVAYLNLEKKKKADETEEPENSEGDKTKKTDDLPEEKNDPESDQDPETIKDTD